MIRIEDFAAFVTEPPSTRRYYVKGVGLSGGWYYTGRDGRAIWANHGTVVTDTEVSTAELLVGIENGWIEEVE